MEMHELLRKYRELRGFTQKEVANKLGMTHSGYSKYERGERKIDIMKWLEITKILDVPYQLWGHETFEDNYYPEYEDLQREIIENDIYEYESIERVVKLFIDKKDSMSDNEREIARELFENVFYGIETDKRIKKETEIQIINEKYEESSLEDAIKVHKVEFLYKK